MKREISTSKAKGFSLVELIVVMFILAVALMGLMALQMASVKTLSGNRNREMAVSLSKSLLDMVQSRALMNRLPLYEVPGGNPPNDPFFAPGPNQGVEFFDIKGEGVGQAAPGGYRLQWMSADPPNGMPRTRELRVEAFWTADAGPNGTAVERSVFMNRLIQF